jgi:hypothetical protein
LVSKPVDVGKGFFGKLEGISIEKWLSERADSLNKGDGKSARFSMSLKTRQLLRYIQVFRDSLNAFARVEIKRATAHGPYHLGLQAKWLLLGRGILQQKLSQPSGFSSGYPLNPFLSRQSLWQTEASSPSSKGEVVSVDIKKV